MNNRYNRPDMLKENRMRRQMREGFSPAEFYREVMAQMHSELLEDKDREWLDQVEVSPIYN